MKQLLSTLLFILIMSSLIYCQSITLDKTIDITNKNDGGFYYPKFSQDGKKIIFTKDNYKGLYLYDILSQSIKVLNDEDGAGYEFNTSSNDDLVFYRADNYINGRKYSNLKSIEINTGITKSIIEEKRDLSTPRNLGNNKIAYTIQENLNIISATNLKRTSVASTDKPFALIENCKIALYAGGKKKIIAPFGNLNYIWPSISPDNSKLLFTCAGKGTFVADLDGNIIADLGYANYPQWSPDGNWISYMIDKDDGNTVTSSEIFISSWSGKKKFQITDTKNDYEMYPSWSPSGDEIVVNTVNGKIQLLKLNIEK